MPKNAKFVSKEGFDSGVADVIINNNDDFLLNIKEEKVPEIGMLIDRKLYTKFEDKVKQDPVVQEMIDNKDIEKLEWYLKENVFDKPTEYFNIPKLEQSLGIDRKINVREVSMNILGLLKGYKTKKEKLEDEFNNFKLLNKDELTKYTAEEIKDIESVFEAYIVDKQVRECVYNKDYSPLFNSVIKNNLINLRNVKIKEMPILEYIKNYVAENGINCENYLRR